MTKALIVIMFVACIAKTISGNLHENKFGMKFTLNQQKVSFIPVERRTGAWETIWEIMVVAAAYELLNRLAGYTM